MYLCRNKASVRRFLLRVQGEQPTKNAPDLRAHFPFLTSPHPHDKLNAVLKKFTKEKETRAMTQLNTLVPRIICAPRVCLLK